MLLTLVEDPVTLVRGQPVSARELLSRYDKDPNGARKRAERDEAARAAAEYAANRQATILAEQKARIDAEKAERNGAGLPRRDMIPDGAFLDLEHLQQMTDTGFECLRLVAVSLPWLTAHEPDPRGDHLRVLARALSRLVNDRVFDVPATYGVMIDYCSLEQPQSPGAERSPPAAARFAAAVEAMAEWYTHPHVLTLMLTRLPADYPLAFEVYYPETNVECLTHSLSRKAEYDLRGWPYFEACCGTLVKDPKFLLDLARLPPVRPAVAKQRRGYDIGNGVMEYLPSHHYHEPADSAADHEAALLGPLFDCALGRRVPLLPAAFAKQLQRKDLLDAQTDAPLLCRLYERAFTSHLAPSVAFDCLGLRWGHVEAQMLIELLSSGTLTGCKRIDLRGNCLRPHDIERIRAAITIGKDRQGGRGFAPTDVRLSQQVARPAPRLCTKLEVGNAEGGAISYAKAQAATATGRLGVG